MSVSFVDGTAPARPPAQLLVAGSGLLALTLGAVYLGGDSWRQAALFIIGGLLGVSLYHAAFGFTSAYRKLFLGRDVAGVTAQLVMIAVAMVLFAPVLAQGEAFGQGVVGAVAPVGVSVAVGSFLFGLGMQLAGGCGSGTLYTVGGGSVRMVATLAAFCAGAFWGSLDLGFWLDLPGWGAISLAEEAGWGTALALQFAVLIALGLGLRAFSRGAVQSPLWAREFAWRDMLAGPWPLLLGAGLLALLNWATLVIAGHPWSITWGFTLWAAKIAAAFGWDPATSPFWTAPFQRGALVASLFDDVTSVMNFGIIIGALTAAGLAGRFRPVLRVPLLSLAAAVIGGLLMGYGARLAFGCNIGAFFSGVASTSLHGWLWIVSALAGTWAGVHLRPFFGLGN
jgi:uncharacterized membrane protein YedE/YeeE